MQKLSPEAQAGLDAVKRAFPDGARIVEGRLAAAEAGGYTLLACKRRAELAKDDPTLHVDAHDPHLGPRIEAGLRELRSVRPVFG